MKRIITYKYLLFAFLFYLPLKDFAQNIQPNNYPQKYFGWPVEAKIGIAANFGEMRPNHYHMGLDARTDQKQNVRVVASADGYIAKVKIESYGFGRCIYINHPNGFTTLYAHLNDFYPALEKYITEQQYLLKKWSIFIDIPANLFPVKKGNFIAYSGNTGGSQGPHTHFEIRNTATDKVYNPSLFDMPIVDNIAPDILRVAVYDRRISTYEQSPKIYPLKKVNGIYTPANGKIIVTSDKVSFAITAWDRYTGSSNQNGIYEATLFDNGKAISDLKIDDISYDETRYINGHIDYKTRSAGGSWLQHLSKLPGYNNSVYKTDQSQGVISLDTNKVHAIKFVASDANGNSSAVQFSLEANKIAPVISPAANNGLKVFKPGAINIFENNNISFYLPENAIYDSFHFKYAETASAAGSNVFSLQNTSVPVQVLFPVKIKGNFNLADTGKIVMKRFAGGKQDFKKAVYENGWYKASFRDFGNFQLLLDNTPPTVISRGLTNGMNAARLGSIAFAVSDNSEDINSFTALLDGNWLRFSNDKGKNFIYKFDEHCPPGEHVLQIIVEDLVGNKTEKTYNFTR